MTMNDVNNKSPFSQHDDVEMNDATAPNETMSDVEDKSSHRRQLRKKRLDNGQRASESTPKNGGWDEDKAREMPSALEAVTALNPNLFPPGQLSIQTFQNAISQFTATAVANNMDNDTIMKNLAILQSALFTLQQQQFLQFQLIQHLQTELIKKQSEKNTNDDANKVESDGENDKNNGDHDHDDNDDEDDDGDNDEDDEMENSRKINSMEMPRQCMQQQQPPTTRLRQAKLPNAGRSSGGEMFTRDPEIRVRTPTKLIEQPPPPIVPEKLTVLPPKPPTATSTINSTISQEEIATYQKNFPSLASNIITDHDNSPLAGESSSLAMLEKKAQEVLNSASQGILSNNFMDELAFANDKANAGTRNDSALFKHRCRYCGKIFGSDSSLQIHLRSHTGERPYKCNICGSRFTTKGNLKVHFQRHSDKYPHIPMNPNPVPEHLDKYFPALMPQEALKDGSSPPAQMPPQMPTQFPGLDTRHMAPRGMFPDFFLPRPPFDLFSPIKEPSPSSKNPVDLSQLPMRKPEQFSPRAKTPEEPIRQPPPPKSPKIKEEPTDLSEMPERPLSPVDQADRVTPNESHDEFEEAEAERKANNNSALTQSGDKDSHLNRSVDSDKKDDSIDAKMQSVSPPSSSSSTSGSLYQDTVLDPAFYSSRLMRPENNDSSWENFIEISSETSKLQDLVDNIDNKNSEPNQCLVCKKVLSCRSALQMHYRVHTGDRPFRCKICGRSFTTKGNLKTHMSVHRIKPPMRTLHQCPVCHQKFSNIFVLQQHIRLHTGEMTDLTPEQIRAAEIRDFDSPPSMRVPPEFHVQKRIAEFSDDESNGGEVQAKSPKPMEPMSLRSRHSLRSRKPDENHAEDLRAKHMQRLSVRSSSNDGFSRGSSPDSQMSSDQKRMRSSSPNNSITKTPPMPTPPTAEQIAAANAAMAAAAATGRPFPYGPPFFGLPQFPPFMAQPQFMRNLPMLPQAGTGGGATGSPFGLFGARGNTTTCNICFKTFACNSALEIHYRSHTKERPFKCTICDRGFSTKGNMKQHMLTHKTRDSNGNCSSGDEESHMSSRSSQQDQSTASSLVKVAIQMERPRSPAENNNVRRKRDVHESDHETDVDTRSFLDDGQYSMDKEADIKKWCNKLNEMPENIAAS